MEFEFEEKETYSLEEVKELVNQFQGQAEETISTKDNEISTLKEEYSKFDDVDIEELTQSNLELSQKNLALKNGIDDEVLEFVIDNDLEKMQEKIDKFKELTKEKEIDNSFKPERKRNDDQYEKAIKDGDIEGSLKYKFQKLFQ